MSRWLVALMMVVSACGAQSSDPKLSPELDSASGANTDASQASPPNTPTATSAGESCVVTAPAIGAYELIAQTDEAGLVDPLTGMHGHAAAWGDVDGNGFPDLYMGTFADRPDEIYAVRGAVGPASDQFLFGDGTTFAGASSFDASFGRTSGAVLVDLDGDGDLDLVASRNAGERDGPKGEPSTIYRNDDGLLIEVESGFTSALGGRSVGVLDFDLDGLVDLFMVEDRYRGGSSRLFRNVGDLRFEDVTESVGLPLDINGLGVAVGNLGGDMRPDIFVSGSNRMFIAAADGFIEADTSVFAWETFGDEDIIAGVDIADVNLDGRMDLVVGHHYNSTVDFDTEVSVRLYLNDSEGGDVRFVDVTDAAGLIPLPTKAPHVEFADMNNDGWLDILTSASAADGTLPAVFLGTGIEGGIPRYDPPTGLGSNQYWVAAPTADYNRDGRLDVFLVEWEPSLPSLLFSGQNEGNWITIGVNAINSAPGAEVAIYRSGRAGDASELLGLRPLTASKGYSAGTELVAHFGLGSIDAVDIVVTLVDGTTYEAFGVNANGWYLLPDGCG